MRATCAVLMLFEGDTGRAVYAVMQGPARQTRRGLVFDANRADTVASYEYKGVAGRPRTNADLGKLAAKHATPSAPVIEWQR